MELQDLLFHLLEVAGHTLQLMIQWLLQLAQPAPQLLLEGVAVLFQVRQRLAHDSVLL